MVKDSAHRTLGPMVEAENKPLKMDAHLEKIRAKQMGMLNLQPLKSGQGRLARFPARALSIMMKLRLLSFDEPTSDKLIPHNQARVRTQHQGPEEAALSDPLGSTSSASGANAALTTHRWAGGIFSSLRSSPAGFLCRLCLNFRRSFLDRIVLTPSAAHAKKNRREDEAHSEASLH